MLWGSEAMMISFRLVAGSGMLGKVSVMALRSKSSFRSIPPRKKDPELDFHLPGRLCGSIMALSTWCGVM